MPRTLRYGLVAALSFTLGTATIATAGPTISGMVGLIDAAGNEAKITAAGELTTSDATAATKLTSIDGKLATDSSGNLRVVTPPSGPITGTVSVSNFPATQNVGGSVSVSNFPSTQTITGNVGDARVTQQLTFQQATIPGNGIWVSTVFQTAGYSQLHIHVTTNASCVNPVSFVLYSPAWITPQTYIPQALRRATLCPPNSELDAVIDVPGAEVYFVAGGLAGTSVNVAAWVR